MIKQNHVHCITALPVDGILPSGSYKRGVDCVITLDVKTLHDMHNLLFLSDARACLIPEVVPVDALKQIMILQDPQLTVFRWPTYADLASCDTDDITCQLCGNRWNCGYLALP